MMHRLLKLIALFLLVSSSAMAQTVIGRVTSAVEGSPLPGVSVLVKGTTTGTTTDADGRFSLNVPDTESSVLTMSFIGFKAKEIPLNNRTTLDVSMEEDVTTFNMYPNFKPVTYRGPSGTGSTIPTQAFYDSYEPGDLRAVDQQGWFYLTYYTGGDGNPFDLGAPYIFKHFNVTANGTAGVEGTAKDNLNVPIIRFAEVLLIYAEAQNEVSGPNQDAYDALKRIRDRAQLTTPALGTFDQATFREAVWRERWHELAFEGITWFDMVRLRKVYNQTTNGFDDFAGHVLLNSNQALQEKHLLFPLVSPEMINNRISDRKTPDIQAYKSHLGDVPL